MLTRACSLAQVSTEERKVVSQTRDDEEVSGFQRQAAMRSLAFNSHACRLPIQLACDLLLLARPEELT